jgi:hypothetical protein
MAGRPADEDVRHFVQQDALECGVGVRRNAGRENDDEAVAGAGEAGDPGRYGPRQIFGLFDQDDSQWRAGLLEPNESHDGEQSIGFDCLEARDQRG